MKACFPKEGGRSRRAVRQVDLYNATSHHDALEFPDATIVKVNNLVVGQRARIVQLPAEPKAAPADAQPAQQATRELNLLMGLPAAESTRASDEALSPPANGTAPNRGWWSIRPGEGPIGRYSRKVHSSPTESRVPGRFHATAGIVCKNYPAASGVCYLVG